MMKNKKALSQVVSTVILILVTIGVIAGIWATVQNLVEGRLEKTGSCYGLFEKIRINDEYTCYDSGNNRIQFSISRDEVDIDSLLVGISMETYSETFVLENKSVNLVNVRNYPSDSTGVSLPTKEGGKTYYVYNINSIPEKIEISPKINQNQCGIADTISQIDSC